MIRRHAVRHALLLSLACAALLPLVHAQQPYPSRPVTILVGSAPGAPSDITTRLIAERLAARWKQPVLVENRPGAGNNLAAQQAARSDADGHTLLVTPDTVITVNPLIYRKMDFDPRADLAPVSVLAGLSQLLVCSPALKITSLAQLVERAKQNKMTYASGGAGVPGHLVAEMFLAAAKIDMAHVPYRGPSPALTDVLGGQVDCGFLAGPTVLPHVRAGKLVALAVSSAQASPLLPEVPTLAQALQVPGLDATFNLVLMAPKATPAPVLAEIERAAAEALQDAPLRAKLQAVDLVPRGSSAREAQATLKADTARWAAVVKRVNLQLD